MEKEAINIIKDYNEKPGFLGTPVILNTNLKNVFYEMIRSGWRAYGFNEFVSNLIPVNRTLLDPRDEWCKQQNFSTNLPTVTVIIYVYNKAWSTLIRTIISILKNSPSQLLDKIILVDDNSKLEKALHRTFNNKVNEFHPLTLYQKLEPFNIIEICEFVMILNKKKYQQITGHLQSPLDQYNATIPKIKLIRTPQHIGILRARMLPVPQIQSPIIMYLESHCECSEGWLEPLVERIKEDSNRIVTPIVDIIDASTFEYIKQETKQLKLGAFTWDLQYIQTDIPKDLVKNRKNPSTPLQTPISSDENVAISKTYLEKSWYTDMDTEICGVENLELSLKTRMCGGSLEIVPCSHIGHILKKGIPCDGLESKLRKSSVQPAKVWLDDYSIYYFDRIGYNLGHFDDVKERLQLRDKLNCKSFKWYLENVYLHHESPEDFVARGQIYIKKELEMCLDASISSQIFEEELHLSTRNCHFNSGTQKSIIKHSLTKLCLISLYFDDSLKLMNCLITWRQKWFMDNYDHKRLAPTIQDKIKKTLKYMNFSNNLMNILKHGQISLNTVGTNQSCTNSFNLAPIGTYGNQFL